MSIVYNLLLSQFSATGTSNLGAKPVTKFSGRCKFAVYCSCRMIARIRKAYLHLSRPLQNNSELKQTTTGTSPNKRFNEHNNGCTRTL